MAKRKVHAFSMNMVGEDGKPVYATRCGRVVDRKHVTTAVREVECVECAKTLGVRAELTRAGR